MSKLGSIVNELLKRMKTARENDDNDLENAIFKELFLQTYREIKSVARIYLSNRDDAEDVLMLTYERARLYLDTYKNDSDGYNWLCKIAQKAAYDIDKKYSRYENIDEKADIISDRSFSMDEYLDRIDLRRALKTLTHMDRKIIHYYFYEKYSMDKIAAIMGVSKNTVWKHLKKCLDDLRRILK